MFITLINKVPFILLGLTKLIHWNAKTYEVIKIVLEL